MATMKLQTVKGGSVMPKLTRAKCGPPVQFWQTKFDPGGPLLVTINGPNQPKIAPVQFWFAKNGPRPILVC